MSKLPFMKLFTADYRDGTAEMTMEQQGFYMRCLTFLHDGEELTSDPTWLSRKLRCNPRTVRKILPVLLQLEKLIERGGKLYNARILRDLGLELPPADDVLEPNSSGIRAELEPNSTRIRAEGSENANEISVDKPPLLYSIFQKPEHACNAREGAKADDWQPEEIPGLNGSTRVVLERVAKIAGLGIHGEQVRHNVAPIVAQWGKERFLAGLDDLEAKWMAGQIKDPTPVRQLGSFVQRAKPRAPAKPESTPATPENVAAHREKLIAEFVEKGWTRDAVLAKLNGPAHA